MVKATKTVQIILECKRIRQERGWSCQRVLDELRAQGGYTSFTSVKRFFAPGSEEANFNYEETVLPIARVLLDPSSPLLADDEPPPDPPPESLLLLKEELRLEKEEALRQLRLRFEADLAAERQHGDELLALALADAQKKVDFLKSELAAKDRLLRRCLLFCAAVLLLVLVYAIIMDAAAPAVGLFRFS